MKKWIYGIGAVLVAFATAGAAEVTSVLLAPVEASQVGSYDWGVVVLNDPLAGSGSSTDRGSLKVNLDLVKFFQDGYAIYSITELEKKDQNTPALLIVLVRPKAK
jgi:hypothetical protein